MKDSKILYSSDGSHLKICQECEKDPCCCPSSKDLNPTDHKLNLRIEKNHRGGKVVTVVYDLPHNPEYFKSLSKKLKKLCGTGGSYKGDTIEIQGDHREKIRSHLNKLGFK